MFLDPIDFATMYKAHKSATDFKGKSAKDWNAKAAEMAPRMIKSPYVDIFLSKMDFDANDTVLDIGCGPGTLALALAKKVKKVIAIDYAEEMLEQLHIHAKQEGITNIETHHIGWDDDWSALPQVDIVVASRSMEVSDLEVALEKMNAHAKKACYLTYKVGGSYVDMEILNFIGKTIIPKPDYWYIPLILYPKGYLPRVDYIEAERGSVTTQSEDEFVTSLRWSLGSLDAEQEKKARHYYEKVIVKEPFFPKPFNWAFISWKSMSR
jgi:cyclopropane fatty-acyl-phospholipid synthase-like methyltransferase